MTRDGRPARRRRCDVAVDTGDPALPVAGTGKLSAVRKSTNSRWRAATLVTLHLIIAAHVTHYLVAGRTVSPVEPSETMYTLELGQINAGFVFLAVALLGTLVFGRFVCGWGCHLVALQDLCGWIMKKLGVRPVPFRSRLLAFAPLAVALYMFVWPTLRRLALGESAPSLSNHLMTDSFWKTFPGPVFAVLTFLCCGFLAVYLLGAKGFCTYACPYGALFAGAGRLSPGSIVVNDDCEQCGHCTATCTSNVLVHEEVRRYGQVVDPGCMKCMDCVTVCPKNALRYSFSRPSLLRGKPVGKAAVKRYPLGVGEEIGVAAVGLAATLAFRGLYDGPPLLMSVALGAATAFLALKVWHLARRPTVRLQNILLRAAGGMRRPGWAFVAIALVWISFTGHSAFAQWHRAWGVYHLNRTEVGRAEGLRGAHVNRSLSDRHHRAVERAARHFGLADRWGLAGVAEVKLGLAWCHTLRGETDAAETAVREAVALDPSRPERHDNLVDLLEGAGRVRDAIAALERKMASIDPTAGDRFRLAGLLVAVERFDDAVAAYEACVREAPDSGPARYNLGGLLRRLGREEEAVTHLTAAQRLMPSDADTQVELGLAYRALGDGGKAVQALRRAIELEPDSPESRLHLPDLIRAIETGERE